MSKLRVNITLTLDGFAAGPNTSAANPLGVGGMALHEWAFPLAAFREAHGEEGGEVNESTPVMGGVSANVGPGVRGRGRRGAAGGGWGGGGWGGGAPPRGGSGPGTGWGGAPPPFHHPVFVLTHH